MNDFAKKFYGSNDIPNGSFESNLSFFIDHYGEFLEMYRVMMAQVEANRVKKEEAHKQLQELRDRLEQMAKSKQDLTEAQKLEIDARKEYLTKMRESTDVIYYNGQPMETDRVARLLVRYQKVFKYIEQVDTSIRRRMVAIMKPVAKVIGKSISEGASACKKDFEIIEDLKDFGTDFPKVVEGLLMRKTKVDLSMHVPKQENFVWE